jgi:tetratricopeptide (TPR) repeat protein
MARAARAARNPAIDPQDALDRAQSLVYDAMDARTAKQRIAIAKKALKISPLCADAYGLLAEQKAAVSDEALDLWRRGVEAGKEALGADFEDLEGEFWGFLETRPYMRVRFGLARALWKRGARDEAIEHLRAMLVLNPNDNQGVRYILAAWLIEAGRDDDLAALLAEYPGDGMADWSWTMALAAFRREGDKEESRKQLADALESNHHVPAYLLGDKPLPRAMPPFISPGEKDEAVHYAAEYRAGWYATPGAIDWLRAHGSAAIPKRPKASRRG